MLLDSDKELYAQEARETAAPANGIPASNFTFSQALSGLWNQVVLPGAAIYGQIEIAKAQADAQAKLNELKTKNATLGPNDPAAAQREANKTLLQQYLPTGGNGTMASLLPWVLGGILLLVGLVVIKRLMK